MPSRSATVREGPVVGKGSAMRRFTIGLLAGAVAGYTAYRCGEAVRDLRDPAIGVEPDPKRYGRSRRRLMLAGIARSLATLASAAYLVAPALEPPAGTPETRGRRLALVAGGLLLSTLVETPADFVEGLVLERRYGLSKQTPGAWAVERAKGAAVSTAIALPLAEALVFAIARAPERWPLVATLGSVPLLVLANVVAPTFIAPLFNRFEPLAGPLEARIRTLASAYGAGDAKILRVDMSKQTEKANAYVTGLFGSRRIVIGDTLLDAFDERETLFVVAHELGHYVQRDVWRGVALGTAAAGAVFFGSRRFAEEAGSELATTTGLCRLALMISLLGALAGPVLAAFSRGRERAADTFAIAATGDPSSGVAAFERLRERNLAEDEQPYWMTVLFSSHPSLGSRIARLREAAA